MSDYNRLILVGRLTGDPERRIASSGTSVVTFTVATNRKSGTNEEVCFAPVTAFGKQGDLIADRLAKGSPILVEGRLRTDQWTTPQGEKRSRLHVICESFSFIGTREAAEPVPTAASHTGKDAGAKFDSLDDDGIPF